VLKFPFLSFADQVLVAILHSTNYDLERAREVATKHFDTRVSLPELFADRDLNSEELRTAFEVG